LLITRRSTVAQVQKIAILGGGAGALAAAYYLSAQPDWRTRYDITVYQQGWRLGGKGASGRNAQLGQRIEEHGLHIWFGCYANAFAMIRAVYAELERPAGAPLARWDEAFRPHDYVVLAEQVDADWRPWHLVLPHRPGEPGTGLDPVTPWQLALAAIEWLPRWHSELRSGAPGPAASDAVAALARALPADAQAHTEADHRALLQALDRVAHDVPACAFAGVIQDDGARRALIALNVATTVLRGMLADGIFTRGFDAANGEDFRAWLARHGGDQELCVNAAPVAGLYSLLFAFEDGNAARPRLDAGVALRILLRLGFAYRGSVMYRMQAGMGDAVFAPLYELLARRGVRFAFFRHVDEIVSDGAGVGAVRMTVQADVPGGDYRPLVDVKGLPCWPNGPDVAQLDPDEAALMQAHGVDLESWWSDWPALFRATFGKDLPQQVLQRGRDFDHVISGLPVDALALAAPGLLDVNPPLRAAVAALRTIATQACQVWLNRDTRDLGWTVAPNGQEPILTTFVKPYDTWAAMTQVLPSEAWPPETLPASVQYFCGPMPQAGLPPRSDTGFPARAAARAHDDAVVLLRDQIQALWPAAVGGFPWQWLVDPQGAEGQARFDRQYWRANVDPAERYVLSVPGSTARRLATDGTGLDNLYLAGDWLRTGVDCGCVEAAVMGGMQAARAISGYPQTIPGDNDGVSR
jgi:uncharacterized protein with NAD-binding domain and iron-sulfur cluster